MSRKTPRKKLTHVDAAGRARMVHVGGKRITKRTAVAEATVRMSREAYQLIIGGKLAKGDVLAVARVAGIQAAKRTSELIPLCHPLNLAHVRVDIYPQDVSHSIRVEAVCELAGRTGVEMEALTAAAIAALTIYDMAKAVDKSMTITDVRLLFKAGGRSGTFKRDRT